MDPPETSFPRLLVVTAFAPNPVDAALVGQLLRGYAPRRLHWWHCGSAVDPGPDLVADQVYSYAVPPKLQPRKRWVRLKSWLVEKVWIPRAVAHLGRLAARVQPEVVWCQLTGWAIPVFHRSGLARTCRSHVSLWDYHDSRMHALRYGGRRARRWAEVCRQLYGQATTCDSVSYPMLEDMKRSTGRADAILVHSGFEPGQLERLEKTLPEPEPEIRIAYAGSIIAPETFAFFVRAVEALRPSLPRPVVFELFSRSFCHQPWFNPEWMRDNGLLEEVRFNLALQRCSWGFSPMHLTDCDPSYNRYSFPNKFGTYLAAGLPLIVLAHRESSAARMIQAYPVGIHSDVTDLDTLVTQLRTAFLEENPRRRYREEILACARTEFDAARMRRRLWDCLGVR